MIAATDLKPGWYRVRVALDTPANPGVRKELHIAADHVPLATLAWNRTHRDDFLVRLEQPAKHLSLSFRHTPPAVKHFRIARVSGVRTTLRAVRAKLKLLNQFNCLGPVLHRGTRLLMNGEFGTFRRKLLKGLPDSRVMKLEAKRAEEAGGAWWRRRSLSAEQLAAYRSEAATIENPQPVAVILPADETRIDHARQAAFSVLRQAFPHWQLRILWPNRNVPEKLKNAIRHDDRASIVTGPFHDSLRRVLAEVLCERAVVLSPDAELAEHALLKAVDGVSDHMIAIDVRTLASHPPGTLPPMALSVVRWATNVGQASSLSRMNDDLAYPLDGGRDPSLSSLPSLPKTKRLVLAGNFMGLSGWDAVAYQCLKGLNASGVEVLRHHHTPLRSHTLPPGLSFEKVQRTSDDPLLLVAPPYQLKAFGTDANTAVLTMWECDRLPAASVKELNACRVVMVPSAWGKETFLASGVTAPIEIVPLGYDPQVFGVKGEEPSVITFGTAGALGAGGLRKNIDGVVKAFLAAFPDEPNVRLRIKLTPNCVAELPNDPRIDITRSVLPPNEVAAWNRSLTAYVNGSLAEGFGLHLLEAMACGVPLISTRVSGPADYFDETVGWVLPHREVCVKNDFYDGRWYEPDFDAMVTSMRNVFAHSVGEKGVNASARARRYTWRDTGRNVMRVLNKYQFFSSSPPF